MKYGGQEYIIIVNSILFSFFLSLKKGKEKKSPRFSIDHETWPTLFNELEGQCIQLPLPYYQDFNYLHTKIIGKCRRYYHTS